MPTVNMKYIGDLAKRNRHRRGTDEAIETALQYVVHAWAGQAYGVRAGVVFLCFIPEVHVWTLDAYKDDELLKMINHKGDFSYRAGRLIMDWFFANIEADELYIIHSQDNRGAKRLSKRLGFKWMHDKCGAVILRRDRDGC